MDGMGGAAESNLKILGCTAQSNTLSLAKPNLASSPGPCRPVALCLVDWEEASLHPSCIPLPFFLVVCSFGWSRAVELELELELVLHIALQLVFSSFFAALRPACVSAQRRRRLSTHIVWRSGRAAAWTSREIRCLHCTAPVRLLPCLALPGPALSRHDGTSCLACLGKSTLRLFASAGHTSSNGIIVQLDPRSSFTAAAAALNRILSAPLLYWVVAWSPLPLHCSLQRAPASGCLRPALPAAFVPGPPPTSSRPISLSSFIITSTGSYHQITPPPRHHLRARHRNRAAQSSFASARQCRANTSPPKPTRSKRIDSLSTNPAPLHLLSPRPLHSTPTASSRSPHPTIVIS